MHRSWRFYFYTGGSSEQPTDEHWRNSCHVIIQYTHDRRSRALAFGIRLDTRSSL
jgi:hypothetical protein